jgi:phosphopantothenoylcysteine decarboxylase/phosphopantothenate--cysteine ligase
VYAAGVGSVFVAPDLDAATADHPAVRENLRLLRRDGCQVIEGSTQGMAPVGEVVARVLGGLGGPMSGLRVLVTAGGTHEPMDSVRFIGNRSSGKMGLAVAREALRLGAEVTVVAANVEGSEPGVGWIPVETVEELRAEVLKRARGADALIMAAAVSDFTPAAPVREKVRRTEGLTSLQLKSTADILEAVRERYPDLFVVGFAATHGDPVADARNKLASKGANLVVGNDISQAGIGFGSDENEVYVVGPHGERFVPRAPKSVVARIVLESLVADMNEERQE